MTDEDVYTAALGSSEAEDSDDLGDGTKTKGANWIDPDSQP